jgi:hypothetical protein
MLPFRLCLSRSDHFLRGCQSQHFLFGELRGRILRRQCEHAQNKSGCN